MLALENSTSRSDIGQYHCVLKWNKESIMKSFCELDVFIQTLSTEKLIQKPPHLIENGLCQKLQINVLIFVDTHI